MQTQIFVCELCYCDLFVYCPPKYAYERVLPSEACHKEIVEKSKVFFVRVICLNLLRNILAYIEFLMPLVM